MRQGFLKKSFVGNGFIDSRTQSSSKHTPIEKLNDNILSSQSSLHVEQEYNRPIHSYIPTFPGKKFVDPKISQRENRIKIKFQRFELCSNDLKFPWIGPYRGHLHKYCMDQDLNGYLSLIQVATASSQTATSKTISCTLPTQQ